jgi:hypothetical protein
LLTCSPGLDGGRARVPEACKLRSHMLFDLRSALETFPAGTAIHSVLGVGRL